MTIQRTATAAATTNCGLRSAATTGNLSPEAVRQNLGAASSATAADLRAANVAQPVMSIDPAEVAFYDQLADSWWDESGPFWPLHRLNGLRTKWLRKQLCQHFGLDAKTPRPLAGLDVLDIGCGGGILSVALASLGACVHGIDVTERNILTARHHLATTAACKNLDLRFNVLSAEELAECGAQYDAVLSMEVVEHVADLPGFVRANCTLTRPGGCLSLSTINRTLRSWLFAIFGAEYILRWLPRGTHQWSRFPRPDELAALLGSNGLTVEQYSGVAVNPFTRRFRLTPNLGVNYMVTAKKGPEKYLPGHHCARLAEEKRT